MLFAFPGVGEFVVIADVVEESLAVTALVVTAEVVVELLLVEVPVEKLSVSLMTASFVTSAVVGSEVVEVFAPLSGVWSSVAVVNTCVGVVVLLSVVSVGIGEFSM